MIKNQIQAGITERRLTELKQAKTELEAKQSEMGEAQYRLGISSFDSLINDLEKELEEYRGLSEGNFHCLQAKSFNEIPNVLIGARLAKKMSQRDLGELIGVKEQQIQRYEMTDYETASRVRMTEVMEALQIELRFEKIIIANLSDDNDPFTCPVGITKEIVKSVSENICKKHSLIFQ